MSEVRDKFTNVIVGAIEDLRLDFHVAMAGAQTVEDRMYLIAGMSHAACVILAMTWPPQQDKEAFRKMVLDGFPALLDGGIKSVEHQRQKEAELFSQILRQAGAMQ